MASISAKRAGNHRRENAHAFSRVHPVGPHAGRIRHAAVGRWNARHLWRLARRMDLVRQMSPYWLTAENLLRNRPARASRSWARSWGDPIAVREYVVPRGRDTSRTCEKSADCKLCGDERSGVRGLAGMNYGCLIMRDATRPDIILFREPGHFI